MDGCAPELTRDGITGDSDSRWSCSRLTSADNAQCEIAFTFEDLQDIVDIEVAFWMGDEVSRRIQVIAECGCFVEIYPLVSCRPRGACVPVYIACMVTSVSIPHH